MALTEKINQDLKAAMKSGDSIKLNTIRSIRAQIIELTKRGTGTSITPDDELAALLAAAKKRKEAIEMYQKGGRTDLVEQEQQELEIINAYLPKSIPREEAQRVVEAAVKESASNSMKDLGKVMSLVMKQLKGKIDGKVIQEIVKEKLGEGSS